MVVFPSRRAVIAYNLRLGIKPPIEDWPRCAVCGNPIPPPHKMFVDDGNDVRTWEQRKLCGPNKNCDTKRG